MFQYVAAQLEPSRCVVCARLPGRVYPKGFHLCVNCEYGDVGSRPPAGRDAELSSSELRSSWRRQGHHALPSRQRVRSPMGRRSDRRDGSRRRPPRPRSRSRRCQNRQRRSCSTIGHSPRRRSRGHEPADSELRSPCRSGASPSPHRQGGRSFSDRAGRSRRRSSRSRTPLRRQNSEAAGISCYGTGHSRTQFQASRSRRSQACRRCFFGRGGHRPPSSSVRMPVVRSIGSHSLTPGVAEHRSCDNVRKSMLLPTVDRNTYSA